MSKVQSEPTLQREEPTAASGERGELNVSAVNAIGAVTRAEWDSCANPVGALSPGIEIAPARYQDACGGAEEALLQAHDLHQERVYNPFISHDFLSALEELESVGGRSGWQVQHLLVRTLDGMLVGAAPCYLKSHSRGEYVFDRGWAEAYEQAGGRYYPKLQVAVPFTPAAGRRLLVRPGAQASAVRQALVRGLIGLCRHYDLSGTHVTFAIEPEYHLLGEFGFLLRNDQQFHWQNAGYGSFDDFLAALASRKRKAIRRERADAVANGVSVHWLRGNDLTEEVWDAFFTFYMETGSRKWGRPYLTRDFYSLAGEKMADRILLVMAKRAGRWIAGAINFIGSHTLFGRHWGAIEHHPFLHFELCYYQAIEFAITHKLAHVEAGAQGEHKLSRGYMPRSTYSAHFIADPALRRAIAEYLGRERAYVAAVGTELAATAPYRKDLVIGQRSNEDSE